MMRRFFLLLILIIPVTNLFAQSYGDYKAVDDYVKTLGSLDTLGMGDITAVVTRNFPNPIDKVRSIFDWVTNNISLDCKAARADNNDKSNSDDVLKSRKATASGYATLFQDMCSVIEIRCLTVDGYTKYSAEDINNPADEVNDTWDVVQLGQTSSNWYYVDPARGSDYTDKDFKAFTKSFNDTYFFVNKSIFNLQHFPDNIAWELGNNGPKDKKEFFALPVLNDAAYEFSIVGFDPVTGYLKIKAGKPQQFSIHVNNISAISVVSVLIGENKKAQPKQVNYSTASGSIIFTYTFDDADVFPFSILINGKDVLDYMIEVK